LGKRKAPPHRIPQEDKREWTPGRAASEKRSLPVTLMDFPPHRTTTDMSLPESFEIGANNTLPTIDKNSLIAASLHEVSHLAVKAVLACKTYMVPWTQIGTPDDLFLYLVKLSHRGKIIRNRSKRSDLFSFRLSRRRSLIYCDP
jgi:hypothetical protein